MFTSFSTALSALSAHATAVDVVGNNLAKMSTTGSKTSVVSFHDLVTQSLGAGLGETQVGFGTARPFAIRQFPQGAVQASSGLLDAAVQGDGFFVLRGSANGVLFTRAGSFQVDRDGNLLTGTKERVQGWTQVNGVLNTSGPIGDIVVPVGQLQQPMATRNVSIDANLNAAARAGATSGAWSTPIEIVDSLGKPLVLTLTFTKDATTPNQWNYDVTVPGEALASGTAALNIPGLADNAADLIITWNLYDKNGVARMTQFAEPSAVSANGQDGVQAAQLIRVALGDGGQVLAQYSNGTQQVVAQLALASIRNPESLIAVGNSNFQASAQTALPAFGEQDTGGRGKILGGSLEASTVDIAREFTSLIVLQRGYQANARVVTAVDEISQETINLKR